MNQYNPNIHHRRSIRLKGYDYSQAGLYFITICVQNRKCLFGEIANGEMILNDAGIMVENEWLKLPERFNNIQLHEYVVMPNHFHAILEIVGATLVVAPLVVAPDHDTAPNHDIDQQPQGQQEGQPQGIAPTENKKKGNHEGNEKGNHEGLPRREIEKGQLQGIAPTKNKTIGDMLGAFQSIVTVEYIRGVKTLGWQPFNGKLWQRNYWEHIIRNEQSYQNISNYIINNPKKWDEDKFKTL